MKKPGNLVKSCVLALSACVVLSGCTRSDNGAPVHWGYGQAGHPVAKATKSEKALVRRAQSSAKATGSSRNGKSVRVNDGDTVYSIARAHSLDVNDLIKTNKIRPPYTIRPGQQLSLRGVDTAVYEKPGAVAKSSPVMREHIVAENDTLYSLSRKYGVSVKDIRKTNSLSKNDVIRPGQTLAMNNSGHVQVASVAPVSKPGAPTLRSTQTQSWQRNLVGGPTPKPTQKSEPVQTASLHDSLPTKGAGSFIWPVTGRVISDYGKKPNGLFNDGVNIAVPPGTSVRASKAGTVTYAGNELKGYGNLLLIKHNDGHVTAYAHNSRLLVRPGDKVQQGDVIAESGSTGAVTSPQVHFEIRRGRKSINPGFMFAGE